MNGRKSSKTDGSRLEDIKSGGGVDLPGTPKVSALTEDWTMQDRFL